VDTNFDDSIRDEEVFDNRHLVYLCDRVIGGGVAIAIKKCEEFWIKIALQNLNLNLCSVYLPHLAPDGGRHICPKTGDEQHEYDRACFNFRELRSHFKSLHRIK
jgi:hypothetical protein